MSLRARTAAFLSGGKAVQAQPAGREPPFFGRSAARTSFVQREAHRHTQAYGGGRDSVDWVFDAVRLYQDAATGSPYHFERKGKVLLPELGPDAPSEAAAAPASLVDLVKQPNPWQDWDEVLSLAIIDYLLLGNAYWLKFNPNAAGQPAALYRMAPEFVTVVGGEKVLIERYEYQLPGMDSPLAVSPADVVHFRAPNPHSPGSIIGLGIIQAAPRAYDVELGLVDAQASFFENGTLLSGVISSDRSVPDPTRRKLKREFKALYGGSDKFYDTAILERGLKYDTIQPTAVEAAFADLGDKSRDRILAMFRVPPILLGLSNAVSSLDLQAARQLFAEDVAGPFLGRLGRLLSSTLTQAWSVDFKFDYGYTLPEADRLKLGVSFAQLPGVRVREVRKNLGLPELGQEVKAPDGQVIDDIVLNVPLPSTEGPGGAPSNPSNSPAGGRPAAPAARQAFTGGPAVNGGPPSPADIRRREANGRVKTVASAKALLEAPADLLIAEALAEAKGSPPGLEEALLGVLEEGKALKKTERMRLVGRIEGLAIWSQYRGVRDRIVNAIAEGVRRGYSVDQIIHGVQLEGEQFTGVRELLRELEVTNG